MVKLIFKIWLLILTMSGSSVAQEGIVVQGNIQDSDEEFISLKFAPRMRGNLNFDGFRSSGTYIDKNGNFKIKSPKVSKSGIYGLSLPNNYIELFLLDGDSVFVETSINDANKTFVRGTGAGKNNIMKLQQFQYEYIDQTRSIGLIHFVKYLDTIIDERQRILKSIFTKRSDDQLIKNIKPIIKIINETPISEKEYNYLQLLIDYQKYSYIVGYISKLSSHKELDTVPLDFNSKQFNHFNQQQYSRLNSINEWMLYNNLEHILQIEYLRFKQDQGNTMITFGNWQKMFQDLEYPNWVSNFLKKNFSSEIYNRYYMEYVGGILTWGGMLVRLKNI